MRRHRIEPVGFADINRLRDALVAIRVLSWHGIGMSVLRPERSAMALLRAAMLILGVRGFHKVLD
jgi:hypothetical protein